MLFLLLVGLVSTAHADLTGQNPAAGSCICLDNIGVNVRDGPCGNVIGGADAPQCFTSNGQKQACTLSGINYEFFSVKYGGVDGWMAGDFLVMGSDSQCSSGGSASCSGVQIVSRSSWGARPPAWYISPLPSKPVGLGFVHHTVGPRCYDQTACSQEMRNIQNYHIDTNGWPDIAYNFAVGDDGRAYEARGWDKVGAHTYGYNDNAVAVVVMGDYTSQVPSQAAQNAVRNIFQCAVQQGILSGNFEMFGHRDGSCTACPGDSYYPVVQTYPEYSFRDITTYCGKEDDPDYVPDDA